LDYPFNGDRESSRIKLISLKEHQIWENQFHELNTYYIFNVFLISNRGFEKL